MSTTITQPLPGATLPTYTEIKRGKVFDWHAFLAKDTHDEDAWHEAVNLAGEWVTCACGGQCAALPRTAGGAPEDEHLYELGCLFSTQIIAKLYSDARETLGDIEQRATLLLITQAALAGKECNTCGGLGCPNCHGGANGKGLANA